MQDELPKSHVVVVVHIHQECVSSGCFVGIKGRLMFPTSIRVLGNWPTLARDCLTSEEDLQIYPGGRFAYFSNLGGPKHPNLKVSFLHLKRSAFLNWDWQDLAWQWCHIGARSCFQALILDLGVNPHYKTYETQTSCPLLTETGMCQWKTWKSTTVIGL